MPLPEKYIPIDCNFYDRIEAAIVLRKVVQLQYLEEQDQKVTIDTPLADTQTKNGAEFLILPSGKAIRMDQIVSLDGVVLPKTC